MDNSYEKKIYNDGQGKCTSGSPVGYDVEPEPERLGIRERVAVDKRRAQEAASRACQLHELEYLLDKNPEIARILDLWEVVRG